MILRPVPTRWFEAVIARDDSASALEALAATGAVELEIQAGDPEPVAEWMGRLEEYKRLSAQYGPYWARSDLQPSVLPMPPAVVLERALRQIRAWIGEADPIIVRLQSLQGEQGKLRLWRDLFEGARASRLDWGLLKDAGPMLRGLVNLLPEGTRLSAGERVLALRFPMSGQDCWVMVGPASEIETAREQAVALKGRCPQIPDGLRGTAEENLAVVQARLSQLDGEIAGLESRLEVVAERHGLRHAVGDIARLEWFIENVPVLPADPLFSRVTGWTSDPDGSRLMAALRRARVRGLIHFPPPPTGLLPPLILRNPWWARPFEIFSRALGIPSAHEADPSRLLAFIVPLLFGAMFGDVGQGFVLLLIGLGLRRRFAVARLLVPGGASAMAFGWLFGSVFSREDLIHPLWMHPLDRPLTILAVPLFGGAALLILGLLLSALEAYWSGAGQRWLAADAGFLLSYAGLIGGFVDRRGYWIAIVGAVWAILGWAHHEINAASLLSAAGHTLEQGFQLAVNTLSFARVGAFALAHAGLSSAVGALASAAGHPLGAFVIILIGNVVIIALEALVVSIQTTRLVLFEFFIRFLRGEGRLFRPLPLPHTLLKRRFA